MSNIKSIKERVETNYFYKNDKLLNELVEKEELVSKLCDKVFKCPNCKKGHFILEDDGAEYYSHTWLECDECGNYPTPYREQMINDINWYPEFDIGLYDSIMAFESAGTWDSENPFKKVRDFSPEAFNAQKLTHQVWDGNNWVEKTLVWEEMVEECLLDYLKELNKIIENSKKYKCLKNIK